MLKHTEESIVSNDWNLTRMLKQSSGKVYAILEDILDNQTLSTESLAKSWKQLCKSESLKLQSPKNRLNIIGQPAVFQHRYQHHHENYKTGSRILEQTPNTIIKDIKQNQELGLKQNLAKCFEFIAYIRVVKAKTNQTQYDSSQIQDLEATPTDFFEHNWKTNCLWAKTNPNQ